MRPARLGIVALVIALVGTACGSSSAKRVSDSVGSPTTSGPTVPDCSQAAPGTTTPGSDALQAVVQRGTPTVTVPTAPAAKLGIRDLVQGTGTTVKPCATVTVEYVGVGQASGKQFDSTWDRGQPVTFPLGQVITGWTIGIPGMRVGGRRELVIPGDLAYADQPQAGSGIQPNETLVFVIDLVAVQQ